MAMERKETLGRPATFAQVHVAPGFVPRRSVPFSPHTSTAPGAKAIPVSLPSGSESEDKSTGVQS